MVSPFEALSIILKTVKPTSAEVVSVFESSGRVMASPLKSLLDLPPQDNAAMDGYALKHSDIEEIPVRLKVKGTIKAGDDVEGLSVESGTCYRIMTGAFIPGGADVVVEFEATKQEGSEVEILKKKPKYANIRFRGEDIKKGETIDFTGEVINPYRLARIVSTGNIYLSVHRKPSVCIVSTGNELAYPGKHSKHSTIDSNSFFLRSLLKQEFDIDASHLGIVPDDEEMLKKTLESATEYDIILTTAGISFGDFDVVTNVEKEMGIKWEFKYVKQKPGKPFAFGKLRDSFIFSFPGNPVSTAFCSFFYLIPALKKMMGYRHYMHTSIDAILTRDTQKRNDRAHFNRVKVEFKDNQFYATPFETQGSNIIESIAHCNGFAMIESQRTGTIPRGSRVKVFMYDFSSIFCCNENQGKGGKDETSHHQH